MVEPDNPAGRLFIILSRARNVGASPDIRNVTQLARLFDIPNEDSERATFEVMHRLTELKKLTDETIESLNKIETLDKEPFLRPFPHIEATISRILSNLAGKWITYHQEIVKIDFVALEFCAHRLSEYPTEQPIRQADFDEILRDVQDLFDEVNREGMPPDLRSFILDQVESIRRAIAEYRIRGVERLREEIGRIIGALYVNYSIVEAPENKPQISKLYAVWLRIKQTIEVVSTAQKLADPFIKLLGVGDHTPSSEQ
jgi:hypothetical protein